MNKLPMHKLFTYKLSSNKLSTCKLSLNNVTPVKPLALLTAALLLSACVDSGTGSGESGDLAESFDFAQMFVNYADNIIIPNYQSVAASASMFAADTGPLAAYCDAIGSGGEATALSVTGEAWDDLQSTIQRSESHIIGPALDNGEVLRNRLNSFQAGDLSTCGIDQSVVLAAENSDFDVTTRTVTQRGIGAVEYLLFNPELDHTCPSQVSETADWNSRPDNERRQLRCEYALQLAEDISGAAEGLVQAWEPSGDNYRSTFLNANNSSSSLEALSDAMFYMDVVVKDIKLGIPTGISSACSGFSCPEAVESPYRRVSLQHIRTNIEAFEDMLTGADGLGFDDIIESAGVPELNSDFSSHIDSALTSLDGISNSLYNQVLAIDSSDDEAACNNAFGNPEGSSAFPVCNLYGFLKRVTDELKVGFVAAVNVDLPDRAQSDND